MTTTKKPVYMYLGSVPGSGFKVVYPHPVKVAVSLAKSDLIMASLKTGRQTGLKNFVNLKKKFDWSFV